MQKQQHLRRVTWWCRFLHCCSCYLGKLSLVALVVLASYVVLGRWVLVPLAADYKPELENRLSRLLGVEVSIGMLEGRWRNFSPYVYLEDLSFNMDGAGQNPERQVVKSIELGLDVLTSLRERRPVPLVATVRGLDIRLQEDAQGHWQVEGFASGNDTDPKLLVRRILHLESFEFIDTRLHLQRYDGATLSLEHLTAGLHKKLDGSHRLDLLLSLQEQPNPILLAADFSGDPFAEYDVTAYLSYRQLELTPVLDWLEDLLPFSLESLRGSAQVWFSQESGGPLRIRSNVGGLALTLVEGNGDSHTLNNIQGLLAGNISDLQRWQLSGEGFSFDHNQRHWQARDFLMGLTPAGDARRINVKSTDVSLALVRDVLLSSRHLPQKAGEVLGQLNPDGSVHNLVMSADLADGTLRSLNLQANLRAVSVQDYYGSPALGGISGYLEMDEDSGRIELDSHDANIHLKEVFDEGWTYDQVQGVINWQLHDDGFSIRSDVLSASNQFLQGHAQFSLWDYQDRNGKHRNELSLLVGAERMDAAIKSRYLPSLSKIRNTMAWLDRAIVAGSLSDSAFIYRGSALSSGTLAERTDLGFFRVNGGELAFLSDWPSLEQVKAYIEVQDQEATISADRAEISGIDLHDVSGRISRQEGINILQVQGQAHGGTGSGLQFLNNSPLRDYIGGFAANWQASGQLQMMLDLEVPLQENARPEVNLVASTADSELLMPDYGLTVRGIQGDFHYDSAAGLSTDDAKAELFGYPVMVDISSEMEAGNMTSSRVVAAGRASVASRGQWAKQPDFLDQVLSRTSGEFDYVADLSVYTGEQDLLSRLILRSDLVGVESTLPEPFRKTAQQARDLTLAIDTYADEREVYRVTLPELMQAELLAETGELQGGLLQFGAHIGPPQSTRPEWKPDGLNASGDISFLNLNDWQALSAELGSQQGGGQLSNIFKQADLQFGTLLVGGTELVNLAVRIELTANDWRIMLENERLGGMLDFPVSGRRPWQVQLDYLRLPGADGEQEPGNAANNTANIGDLDRVEDVLAGVDPASLPAIDFKTAEFALGDKQLGAWSFLLEPYDSGAYISNLKINMGDANLHGQQDSEEGAELDWRLLNGEHESRFNGRLEARNLAEVLPPLGFDANIESSKAVFDGNLTWKGTPAAFRPDRLQGTLSIAIDDGRFVDIDSGSSRLFGALNLDSLVRRMQLDFSDLYKKGMTFDEIDGLLDFDEGMIRTRDQLRIDSPSSMIRVEGELDLKQQTILADLLVSVPLSQNISVLAGLLGAWPIAISTYLVGRIFEEQLAEATAIVYHLEGPLNNLEAGFKPAEETEE